MVTGNRRAVSGRRGRATSAGRFLWSLIRPHRYLLAGSLALTLTAALFEGSTMAILAMALEVITGGVGASDPSSVYGKAAALVEGWRSRIGMQNLFLLLVVSAVVSQIARSLLEFSGRLLSFRLLTRAEEGVRRRLFRQFMDRPLAEMERHKLGDLASYLEHVSYVGQAIQKLGLLVNQLLLLLVYLVLLLWLSWPMTVVALVAGIGLSVALRPLIRRVRETGGWYKTTSVALSELVVEFLGGMRLLRSFGREPYALERVDLAIRRNQRARLKGLSWQAAVSPLVDVLTVLGVAVFLGAGYFLFGQQGPGSLPRLGAFLFVLFRMAPRLRIVHNNYSFLPYYAAFLERVDSMLRSAAVVEPIRPGRPYGGLRDRVQFSGVSMRYAEAKRWAVRDISFTLQRGRMVALVGESGSGKSTVADLLIGLYPSVEGSILVDGVELTELDWTDWRHRIGSVDQRSIIFHASVRENIAFGRPDASEEEILAAAADAHAHEFIVELEDGYDTVVGDQGYRLSGGQRQRVSIARAILRNPEILVLDEATSDLDSESERLVQEAVLRLRHDRTVLAIAHRLSTITMADEILVLDRGRIVERGSHEELLATGGLYQRMWRLQAESRTGGRAEPLAGVAGESSAR